ncbi:foldase protein PrsA [Paenibacillus endophyticus]|uniref:peptidylprolyl isomerase n=1 Tax=Paenibacillus endophyticus TaxID=1294268 RepID=A0A7W5GD59_9BACL|nr:peptidylprolyl isomerase [Paenibacillus endophyticus]MBB3156099.1 foldase protein PrsA [Paenibacillus endophyticus]
MRKYEVLRTVVILQAVCMVVLTVVVIIKVWPGNDRQLDNQAPTNVGSEEEPIDPGKVEPSPEGDHSDQENGRQVIARVGKETITAADLQGELQKQYGEATLRSLMVRRAIDLESAAFDLSISSDEQSRELAKMVEGYESESRYYEVMQEQLGMSREQVLDELNYRLLMEKIVIRSVNITDEEVDRYIADHPEEFEARTQLHLQWIMTESSKEANSVLRLLTDGADFAELARTYSIDSFTADGGGDLGLIDADDPFYNSEMLETASRLQVAEMAGPIKVDGGFAVIRLIERQMTTTMTGRRLHDAVRKQLALEQADSLAEMEDKLLAKYDAVKIE